MLRECMMQTGRQTDRRTDRQTERGTQTDKHANTCMEACPRKSTDAHMECCLNALKHHCNISKSHSLHAKLQSEQHCNPSKWHTLRPSSEARSADTSTKAAAPSAMMELLPAVTVPPSLPPPSLTNTGGRLRSLSGFTFNTGQASFTSVYCWTHA